MFILSNLSEMNLKKDVILWRLVFRGIYPAFLRNLRKLNYPCNIDNGSLVAHKYGGTA